MKNSKTKKRRLQKKKKKKNAQAIDEAPSLGLNGVSAGSHRVRFQANPRRIHDIPKQRPMRFHLSAMKHKEILTQISSTGTSSLNSKRRVGKMRTKAGESTAWCPTHPIAGEEARASAIELHFTPNKKLRILKFENCPEENSNQYDWKKKKMGNVERGVMQSAAVKASGDGADSETQDTQPQPGETGLEREDIYLHPTEGCDECLHSFDVRRDASDWCTVVYDFNNFLHFVDLRGNYKL